MKKAFFYLFSLFCFVTLSLVSCEKPETGNKDDNGGGNVNDSTEVNDSTIIPDINDSTEVNDSTIIPEGTIRLQALNSEYKTGADMGYSSASHSFLLMFATDECEVVKGTAFGTGGVLVFELCSETADGLLPAEGIYRIEDMAPIEDGMIIGGFDAGLGLPFGTYRHNMVDSEFVDWDLITGGAVEIKKGKAADELEFYIYAVFEDGTEENYYYGGKLLVSDLSSSVE